MPLTTVRIPLAIAAASLLLFSCGGEETPDPPKAAEDAAPTTDRTPPEPARQPDPPAKAPQESESDRIEKSLDPDGKSVSLKGTDGAGRPFSARIGENVEIPDHFPKDVPVFPNALPLATMTAEGHGTFVSFSTQESQEAIHDYYLNELAAQGWTIGEENSFRGQLSITATKDIRKAVVTIAGTEGDSRVSVVVTEEE